MTQTGLSMGDGEQWAELIYTVEALSIRTDGRLKLHVGETKLSEGKYQEFSQEQIGQVVIYWTGDTIVRQ